MTHFIDRTGHKYGRLTVRNLHATVPRRWLCDCECGGSKVVSGAQLVRGTKSCGCLVREMASKTHRVHGMTKTPTMRSWEGAKFRCFNPNSDHYDSYGGRGITMCDRWRDSFPAFFEDMGERPLGTTLDRIDTNGNYEPSNCKWGTHEEQVKNKRTSIVWNGESYTPTHISRITGIPLGSLKKHLNKGLEINDAIREAKARMYRPRQKAL